MTVAIRCQHGAFFSRALELLGHGKTDTVNGARNSGFMHENAWGGVGEAPNSPSAPGGTTPTAGKGVLIVQAEERLSPHLLCKGGARVE
eukprot:scaffold37558_cov48-Phaeocystis_antarctica.AAC.3